MLQNVDLVKLTCHGNDRLILKTKIKTHYYIITTTGSNNFKTNNINVLTLKKNKNEKQSFDINQKTLKYKKKQKIYIL